MKAYALTAADQPASLVDLPDPQAPAGGALIRVRAASLNWMDVYQAAGYLTAMMPHDLPTVVGRDFAGVVEAVGEGRADLAVGDEVVGFIPAMPPLHTGSWAEFVPAGPDVVLAAKPASLSFEVGAALPLAGATALDAVHATDIKHGDVVLVVGATGGVGSFVIQFAKHHGATVIATARAGEQADHVRALGADEAIDHTAGDIADVVRARYPEGVDVVIDLVNRENLAPIAALVRDGGRIATTMGSADVEGLATRGVTATNVMAQPTPEKLAEIAEHVDEGSVRVEIQGTYPLAQAGDATAAFAAGKLGKLVVTVD